MGVRPLTERDREQTLSFLGQESAVNVFLIGDIYNHGFESDFQQLWGDFDPNGHLRAVLLRYYEYWIPYARSDFDVEGFAHIMQNGQALKMLSGIDRAVEPFRNIPNLPFQWEKSRRTYFAQLTELSSLEKMEKDVDVSIRRMKYTDIEVLAGLSEKIEEFTSRDWEEEYQRMFSSHDSRGLWAEKNGRAVAMVRTAAENPASAMIVGVGTHPSWRKKGLATQLMIRLCREVLKEGKHLALFYDNPEAGSIYRRLGFREIGTWNMVSLSNT